MNPKRVACAQASKGPQRYFPKTRFTRLSVSGHVDGAGKRVSGQESCFAVWFVLYRYKTRRFLPTSHAHPVTVTNRCRLLHSARRKHNLSIGSAQRKMEENLCRVWTCTSPTGASELGPLG